MNLIRVTELEVLGGLRLRLVFNDGLSGILDFSNLLTGNVFSSLKTSEAFSSAQVQYGTVVWEGDIDMAPEYLHAQMLKQGIGIKYLSPAG